MDVPKVGARNPRFPSADEKVAEPVAKARETGGTASREAAPAAPGEGGDSFERAGQSLFGVLTAGAAAGSTAIGGVGDAADLAGKVGERVLDEVSELAQDPAGAAARTVGAMTLGIGNTVRRVREGMQERIEGSGLFEEGLDSEGLAHTAGVVARVVGEAIGERIEDAREGASGLADGIGRSVGSVAGAVGRTDGALIRAMGDVVLDAVDGLVPAGDEADATRWVAEAMVDEVAKIIEDPVGGAARIIGSIPVGIEGTVRHGGAQVIQGALELVENAGLLVGDVASHVGEVAGEVAADAADAAAPIADAAGGAAEAAGDAVGAAAEAVGDAAEAVGDAAGAAWDALTGGGQ